MIKNMSLLTGMQIRIGRMQIAEMTKKELSDCADVGTTTITRIESKRNEVHDNWKLLHKIEKCLSPRMTEKGWRFTESGGVEPIPKETPEGE